MARPRFYRTAAAAGLFLALLSGCGDSERDRARERVNEYVRGEQELMRSAEPEFRRANETFLAYARGELSHEDAARGAAQAKHSIRDARDAVAALDPPPEAQALHDLLVGYLQANVDVARETAQLATYVPAAERAIRQLARANRALESRLADAEERGAQAGALDRFHASVAATLADVRDLDPPGVLEPTHDEQVRRLTRTSRLADGLRRAVVAQEAERLARLLKRFRVSAPARRPGVGARLALAQYKRRLARLNEAYANIRREQIALARALG
jgi:hypothetical protein